MSSEGKTLYCILHSFWQSGAQSPRNTMMSIEISLRTWAKSPWLLLDGPMHPAAFGAHSPFPNQVFESIRESSLQSEPARKEMGAGLPPQLYFTVFSLMR